MLVHCGLRLVGIHRHDEEGVKEHANKRMVLTLPARGSFSIIARHNGLGAGIGSVAPFCCVGRGRAAHARR